jgi:hypothetical protein
LLSASWNPLKPKDGLIIYRHPPLAFSFQPSAISHQENRSTFGPAIRHQLSAISHQENCLAFDPAAGFPTLGL